MKNIIYMSFSYILLFSSNIYAGPSWVYGVVSDVTSIKSGLLVRVKDPTGTVITPDNCVNPNQWGWMLISSTDKTMIATALAMRLSGKRNASIYTTDTIGGYCNVIQYDPQE